VNERLVTISDRLRAWADVHEKAVFFMDDDPELVEETNDEVALLREAADELDRLANVRQNVGSE
jgi:hypothetical protein